jgi:hypothetical protein
VKPKQNLVKLNRDSYGWRMAPPLIRSFDHAVIVAGDVAGLDRTCAAMQRLGFEISLLLDSGAFYSRNILFGSTFLALVGVHTPDRLTARQRRDYCDRSPGIYKLLVNCDDIAEACVRLADAGNVVELHSFAIDKLNPDGTKEVRRSRFIELWGLSDPPFRFIVFNRDNAVAGDPNLRHPNGAVNVTGLTVALADPAAVPGRYASLFAGTPVAAADGAAEWRLGDWRIDFLAPARLARQWPDVVAPGVTPQIVAATIGVRSIGETADFLARQGAAFTRTNQSLVVSPAVTGHVALRFEQVARP